MDKPPIGIIPKMFWDEQRMSELAAAIGRYAEAGLESPKEWFIEYGKLLEDYHGRTN